MDWQKYVLLDKNHSDPLYMQLSNSIISLIRQKFLLPDQKLPSIRSLALCLGVNTITVVNGYKLLEQQGFAYSKAGSGTYVSSTPPLEDLNSFSLQQIQEEGMLTQHVVNFASASPSPLLFNMEDFKKCINEVLDQEGAKAFGYPHSAGYLPLKKTLCEYNYPMGITVAVDNIHIISGAQQGIDLIAKALLRYGDTVIIESPTYQGAVQAFLSRGAQVIEVSILQDGVDLTSLEHAIKKYKPKLFYGMIHNQNPTGVTYSEEKKKLLLQWAKQYDFLIVEDDFLSELHYLDSASFPLKSLDTEDRVIYIKSFSKLMMPGLRLGYMIAPLCIQQMLLAAKRTSDISSSEFLQRALTLYISQGFLTQHIEQIRKIYLERYIQIRHALETYLPTFVCYNMPKGGVHIWLSLPQGFGTNSFYELCKYHGILISPGSVFYRHIKDSRHFRLSFGAVLSEEIEEGIKKLSSLLQQYIEKN